ncbi:glycosyltransferase family 4 protein [Streptomyces luteolifulvus]|jgi:glycosyltransferase involved in cell wall biosynthesis|uniref:Glycosyltransferase family 4 protein n=1 Tax=Streptomyces luteolifulvus TaxID=2615112 RepID=A0A6H9URE6_9ACTN|nr:glycosyltransferase [Streptomyces luteolifulvus]KAB1140765.1 glycosyltransferase family 4 protein [Streptomyces luteolifulvus]
MTATPASVPATTGPQLTVVTISGARQADVDDSADFRTWAALADRVGQARCVWAGPGLECFRGSMHVLRRPRRTGPRSLIWAAGSVRIGVRLARAAAVKGETVVLNGAEPWGWLSAWLVARLVRRPWLMDIHGDYLALPVASLGRWRRAVLRRAVVSFARRATARRVVAQSMREALDRRGIPSVLVPPRLLPVWEKPPERARPPLAGASPQLLTVGRLVSSKGYDLLLTALAELVPAVPGIRLRIVGDGPLRDRLTNEAARLGLRGHVEFLGARGVDEVRSELSRADLFVISSRDEGLPRTLLEATASGVPVVATTVGGIPAAAGSWPSVSLVTPDAAAIAAGVRRVLASPPDADQLASVRRDVLASYGFDTNLDALAALFRTVGTP